ncbi:MAG: Fic family protein [Bacilli bacterium]|jgi:Fic family protein
MDYFNKKRVPLKTEDKRELFYNKDKIKRICEETELFLSKIDFIHSLDFTKKILFPYEIKYNNSIEGYKDNIENILNIINHPQQKKNKLKEDYQRIRNLVQGYKYILNKKQINKQSLQQLYHILSNNLLKENEQLEDHKNYRQKDVYIFFSERLDIEPDKGVCPKLIPSYIEELLSYINSNNNFSSKTDHYIKSQIIHYYFVYVHPYYDINGRTARTLSLWYLIKNKSYPFTIFNRSIPYKKNKYYKTIREVKQFSNINFFLTYMLENVQKEIEKEYVIAQLDKNSNDKLTYIEKQTLQYIMENKVNTLLGFKAFYNRFNKKEKMKTIYEIMLSSLIEKRILLLKEKTNKIMFDNKQNHFYELNEDLINDEKHIIKKLELKKDIKKHFF